MDRTFIKDLKKTGEEKVVGTEKRHKCSCGCDNLAAGCPKCGGE